ncbi:putative glutamyl-trna amidotransferase subunit a [Phaeomoniella chlamydospora]|uniref:Putative glutamyl-trna amidotransferase subunit a n=1 Tax=Phaeomoniella chlamydospora TaxID=158046 RepID=A0A0G2DW85_PHACM|nr:putative glutamyl-trna amidotransferase subunit a [Phaeomoniella chlamydospora]
MGIGDKGPMGRLLIRGEYGHDIVDDLRPLPGEVVVDKPGKGSFWATGLHRKLVARGVTHLIFCGVTTECCVTTTAREAADRGFECCILTDCTGGFNASYATTSLDMICSYDGLFGFTAPSADLTSQITTVAVPSSPPSTPPERTLDAQNSYSLDIKTLTQKYHQDLISPADVVNMVFDKVEEYETINPHVWIQLRTRAEAVQEAMNLSRLRQNGNPLLPLYGIPFAVKDNFDVAGMPTTAACPAYTYQPGENSFLVTALIAAGAILIGKTNMDQLATGLSGCRSPYGTSASVYGGGAFITGGSSSGSGVAVGAGLVSFSLGTDTAGSGRVPAAYNGIVGMKPTKGTLSARGIVPACRSLDTASIFATSSADARKVWEILDVYDPLDAFAKLPSSLPLPQVNYLGPQKSGFGFAVPPLSALDAAECDPQYLRAFDRAISKLESIGGRLHLLTDSEYAPFRQANDLLYTGSLVNERVSCIGPDFIFSNLDKLHSTTRDLFASVISRPTKPWDIYTDLSIQQTCTRKVQNEVFSPKAKIDVLVVPTTPFHPTIKAMEANPIGLNGKIGEFTHFANVLDLCAVSVNAEFMNQQQDSVSIEKMPFGISFICGSGLDGKMMDIATAFETAVIQAQ